MQFGGISVHELRWLKPKQAVFAKSMNTLFVGNIYPFFFLGVGKIQTLDDALDADFKNASRVVEHKIESALIQYNLHNNSFHVSKS